MAVAHAGGGPVTSVRYGERSGFVTRKTMIFAHVDISHRSVLAHPMDGGARAGFMASR
jgi:hypothetical protein